MRDVIVVIVALLGAAAPAWGSGGRGPKVVEGVVNLNAATTEELQLLPGVGPSKVRNIVAYRAKHPFRTVDELARIKGIGRKMVRKLRPYLAVNGPTTARAIKLPPGAEPPKPPPVQAPPPPKPAAPPRAQGRPVVPAARKPAPRTTAPARPAPVPRTAAPRSSANQCLPPP